MLELTGQTAKLLAASAQEARALAGEARAAAVRLARSRTPKSRRKAASVLCALERLETFVERSLGKPTEFGYVEQVAEVTPHTKPGENELLPTTVAELQRLGLSPREVALDGGFQTNKTAEALAPLAPFIAGRASAGSRRTKRRLARYRVGSEGRISHLKRSHGLRRSRLKGGEGERTWSNWAVFTHNVETYGAYA